MSITLKQQLRAIAEAFNDGHAGISVSYIDALNRAASRLKDQSDLSERLRHHAQALATPGIISIKPLIETINEAADCL